MHGFWFTVSFSWQIQQTTDKTLGFTLWTYAVTDSWLRIVLTETLEARTPSNFGILWHCSSNNIVASTHMLYTLLPQSYRQQHIFVITLIVNVNTMFHSCLHWNICRLHQPNLQKFQYKYQSLILQLNAIQDRLTWFTVAVQRWGFIRSQLAALNCHLPLMDKATM